jgi:hypothetical protein
VKTPLLLAALVAVIATADARADGLSPSPRCRAVDADFSSAVTLDGCTSSVGLCAAGELGHDPILKGTMFVTLTAVAPAAGLPDVAGSTLSVQGVRTMALRHGAALTLDVVGIFDTAQGRFVELNTIIGGAGPLAGATGTLSVAGRPTGPGTFAGAITGTICVP